MRKMNTYVELTELHGMIICSREVVNEKIVTGGTLAGRDVLVIQDYDSFESWYEIWEVGAYRSDYPCVLGSIEPGFSLVETTSELPQDFIPAGWNE